MRDRTRELRQAGGGSSEEEEEEAEGRERAALVELGKLGAPDGDTLQQARALRALLRRLELRVAALEQQQEAELGTPLPPPEQRQQLQQLRDEIQQLTREIGARLRALEPRKDEDEETRNSVRARVRRTQHAALCRQLQALAGRCQEAQTRHRQRGLGRLRRQLSIAGSPPVSEQELEQMLESGQSQIFIANVLGAAGATRAALQEVEGRHQELQQLERGLRELGELWALLGATLEEQGELLDRVEQQVQQSGTRLQSGRQHLGAAQRSQRGARRKKLLVAGCVGVTVVVIVTIIGVTAATG